MVPTICKHSILIPYNCCGVEYCVGIDKDPEPLTARRLAVLVMTVFGVALVVAGTAKESIRASPLSTGWIVMLILLTFVVGLLIPVQTMFIRRICAELVRGSFIQAVWWNFFEGFVVALVVLIFELSLNTHTARSFPARYADSEWYMYFGGTLGFIYVYIGALFTGYIGYEVYFVSIITGQLVGTLLVAGFGLLTARKMNIGPLPIVGCILAVLPLVLHATISKRHDMVLWQKETKDDPQQQEGDSTDQQSHHLQPFISSHAVDNSKSVRKNAPPRDARGLWAQQSEISDNNLY
jgi:uncharacterized membrane protein YdcZ (DUF606 family)